MMGTDKDTRRFPAKAGRVLVLYYSNLAVCGIGNWLETLSQELTARGWEVIVGLAWGRKYHDPRIVEESRPVLKTIRMDGRTGTREGRVQAIERAVRTVKPDIVILTCLDAAFEAVRRLRHKGMKFRFIVTNHGNLPLQAGCIMGNRDVVDMIVCVGNLSYTVMSNLPEGFPPERMRHIPNAVPLPADGRSAGAGGAVRIGYAGRLTDVKRAADLVPFYRALAALNRGAELWIAGEGDRQADILSLTEEFPDTVKYVGLLTRQELYEKFYPQINIIVNFSPNEGWGLSIAEAMAHGVVPVTSAFCGIHHEGLVRNGSNGVVFPVADPERAARLAAQLANDGDRLGRLGRQAAADIREKFSPECFGRKWEQALKDALSLPPLPNPTRTASLAGTGRSGVRESRIEMVRRLLRRRVPHASPGEEWPHFVCRDKFLVQRIAEAMQVEEGKYQ